MRVRIMSMVFGVESLKKNGMPPGIGSLRQLAFAPLLSAKSFPPSHARMSAV
jgi:hypothetical protein